MSDEYRPELADFFDKMEEKYGANFSFDLLTDDEILTMDKLATHAIQVDPKVHPEEKKAMEPLLQLMESQRSKRKI